MSKVYIVEWLSAETHESGSGVLKVFSKAEDAQAFVDQHQDGPYGFDLENGDYGYFVYNYVDEYEVE